MKLKDLKNVKFVIIDNLTNERDDILGDYVEFETNNLNEAIERMKECEKHGGAWADDLKRGEFEIFTLNVEFENEDGEIDSLLADCLEDWDFKNPCYVRFCGKN